MRTIVIWAVVLVAIANGIHGQSVPEGKKRICEPGTQSMEDCNTCICSKDGTALGCTRMECPKIPAEYLNPDGSIKLPHEVHGNPLLRAKRERVCEPGTRREWQCNTCRCSPDGTAEFCTRKMCPDLPRQRRNIRCTPNKSYMDDCNHCMCGPDGRTAACTMMACPIPSGDIFNADGSIKSPHENNPLLRTRRDQICTPGTRRIWDCNECLCSQNGSSELCTRRTCREVPRSKRHAPFSCKPKESFMQECNSCICSADGRSAACTYRFCF